MSDNERCPTCGNKLTVDQFDYFTEINDRFQELDLEQQKNVIHHLTTIFLERLKE